MSAIINEKPGKVCQKITISVIGGHDVTAKVEHISHDIGILVAKVECVLICGGLSGVMEAACKGAKKAGGLTIGLLPGTDKADANPYVDIALPTSLGFARNACVACSSDIIIALPGSHGTNSEICYGLVYKRPVIDFGNWNIKGMIPVKDIKELEAVLRKLIREINKV
jgi:uncharacterized protein (TIGR00725 family)